MHAFGMRFRVKSVTHFDYSWLSPIMVCKSKNFLIVDSVRFLFASLERKRFENFRERKKIEKVSVILR
jgi:hypothetical protein